MKTSERTTTRTMPIVLALTDTLTRLNMLAGPLATARTADRQAAYDAASRATSWDAWGEHPVGDDGITLARKAMTLWACLAATTIDPRAYGYTKGHTPRNIGPDLTAIRALRETGVTDNDLKLERAGVETGLALNVLDTVFHTQTPDPLMAEAWLNRLGYKFHDFEIGNGIDPTTRAALPELRDAMQRLDRHIARA